MIDMNCRICGSDDTRWISTVMINDEEGYEVYVCKSCRGRNEIGIKVNQVTYTGIDNVCPCEEE